MNPFAAGQMAGGISGQHAATAANPGMVTGGTMEGKHWAFWHQFESTFRQASQELQDAGIAWMVDMLTPILIIATLTFGAMMASGEISSAKVRKYGGRTLFMLWLVVGGGWAGAVNQLVLEDFPNELAQRIHGVEVGLSALEQFRVVDEMIKGMAATALGQATGPLYIGERLAIRLFAVFAIIGNDLMFLVWTVMRIMLYMVVTIGAFLLVFIPFDSTIGIVKQLFGKIVGLSIWQLAANVTVKVMLVGTMTRVDDLAESAPNSVGNMIDVLGDMVVWNLWMFITFLMIPAFAGYMSGIAASQTAVQGVIFSAAAAGISGTRNAVSGLATATNRTVARLYATTPNAAMRGARP